MKQITTCLSPDLMPLYEVSGKTVVVVDILRATSCMTTAFAHGVKCIRPVAEVEEGFALRQQAYVVAGERGGQKVEGFDLGNSPFEYMEGRVEGKKVGITTTNGTRAISLSKGAELLLIGSFLNLDKVAKVVNDQPNDVLVICAGWKGHVNLEDTLFAGALAQKINDQPIQTCDSTLMAISLYQSAKNDLLAFLQKSSHVQRLKGLGIEKDIAFCLRHNEFDVVPRLVGDELVL